MLFCTFCSGRDAPVAILDTRLHFLYYFCMLTIKQEMFVLFYLESSDATKSYRLAYNTSNMKDETIWSQACILLKNQKVAARIEEIQGHVADKLLVSEDSVLTEFARIGFSDPRELYNDDKTIKHVKDLDDNTAHAVQSIKMGFAHGQSFVKEIKLWPKVPALDTLAKRLGLFKEQEDNSDVTYNVTYNYREKLE